MSTIFKKSAISLIVLGLTGSAFAMQAAPANYWDMNGAFIGGEGLYLQPMNDDLDYATLTTALNNPNTNYSISPDYNWGWRIYGGLNFGDHDDFTLSWEQFHTNDSTSIAPGATLLVAPRWLNDANNGTAGAYSNVSASASFNLDDAWGVFGHTIHFNNPWSMRFAGGVEWARLNGDFDVSATATAESTLAVGTVVSASNSSNFHGVGPRMQYDVMYGLPYGLGLFANLGTALLVGERDLQLTSTGINTTTTGEVNPTDAFFTRNVLLPKLDLRLGIGYGYTFGQVGGEGCTSTTLTVEAGWQTEHYFNAVERVEDNGGSIGVDGFDFITTKTSDYSNQGLFVGARLNTNWM